MTVQGGYVTFKRGSVLLKTPLWVCFLLKAKVFCQIIYVVSVDERPVSKRQPDASLDASKSVWGSWKKQLQRGVTPLYSAPLTFLEGVRQRWDSPGLLKVMDVLIFASAHVFFLPYELFTASSRPCPWGLRDTCDPSASCLTPQSVHTCPILFQTSTLCAGASTF